MERIIDYVRWYQNIHFALLPFNEVDNYIVAKIGCCDFDGIVPEDAGQITLFVGILVAIAVIGLALNML